VLRPAASGAQWQLAGVHAQYAPKSRPSRARVPPRACPRRRYSVMTATLLRACRPPYPHASTHRCLAVSRDEGTQVVAGAPGVESSRRRLTRVDRYTPAVIERSGPAIRAALLAHAPAEECARFEAELRIALAQAAENLDLSGPLAVLRRWHALATMAANPPTDGEREQVSRAKAGDFTGLSTQDENGNWIRL
jgi:hypothetical protein